MIIESVTQKRKGATDPHQRCPHLMTHSIKKALSQLPLALECLLRTRQVIVELLKI